MYRQKWRLKVKYENNSGSASSASKYLSYIHLDNHYNRSVSLIVLPNDAH